MDVTAGGTEDGTSWVDAFNDVQDALAVAQVGDEIWVARGTYTPDRGTGDRSTTFQLVSGVGLYGGFAGWETHREQRDPVINETILSGDLARNDGPRDCAEYTNCCSEHEELSCDDPSCEAFVCDMVPGCCDPVNYPYSWDVTCTEFAEWACCHLGSWNSCENAYQVVTATASDASTVLDGFTVSAAYACYARDGDVDGFGMFCEGGALTIGNCTFTGNAYYGLYSDSSDLSLASCRFIDNMWLGFLPYHSNVTLGDCSFIANGTGMYGSGSASLSNCTFRDNRKIGLDFSGDTTVTNCTFTGNSRGLDLGGGRQVVSNCDFIRNRYQGMWNSNSITTLTDCMFVGNSSSGLFNGSVLEAINCAFLGNSGRGIYDDGGSITLTNCIIHGNYAVGHATIASGLFVDWGGTARLRNCTVAGNYGAEGIKIGQDGSATLTNCILWGNYNDIDSPESAQIKLWYNATVTVNHSVVQGWTGALGGIGNFSADPLFVDADGADDIPGTEDDDLRLAPNSPGMNRGDPGFTPDLGETDFDGNPRLQGCRVDMGPYESDALQLLGDFDGNSRFDLSDFAGFQICLGAGISYPSWLDACVCTFDFNQSQTLDLVDFADFRKSLTGP